MIEKPISLNRKVSSPNEPLYLNYNRTINKTYLVPNVKNFIFNWTSETVLIQANIVINGNFLLKNTTLHIESQSKPISIIIKNLGSFFVEEGSLITKAPNATNGYKIIAESGSVLKIQDSILEYVGTTNVYTEGSDSGLYIMSELFILERSVIQNSGTGMYLSGTKYRIKNSIIRKNYLGLYVNQSKELMIQDSLFSENEIGIILSESSFITFHNNTINHAQRGIELHNSFNINSSFSTISHNSIGIIVQDSSNCSFHDNMLLENTDTQLYLEKSKFISIFNNSLQSNNISNGLILNDTIGVVIRLNQIIAMKHAIVLQNTEKTDIFENRIEKQIFGFSLNANNTQLAIEHNIINNNTYVGLFVTGLVQGIFQDNMFSGANLIILTEGMSTYSDLVIRFNNFYNFNKAYNLNGAQYILISHNYYFNSDKSDHNGDGICDTPYEEDSFPLKYPKDNYEVEDGTVNLKSLYVNSPESPKRKIHLSPEFLFLIIYYLILIIILLFFLTIIIYHRSYLKKNS
ncbi:MAG: right-handed parallel beta-helix repeat-containing protein [Candidatus Hodarchaeales archaeon]